MPEDDTPWRLRPWAEQRAEAVRLYGELGNVVKVARRMQRGNGIVTQMLKQAGVSIRRVRKHRPDWAEKQAEAVKLYRTGGLEVVGRTLGVDAGTVRNMLVDAGVPIRPVSVKSWGDRRAMEALRLQREEHLSHAELAQRFNTNEARISDMLRYARRKADAAGMLLPGLKPRRPRTWGDDEARRVTELHHQGLSQREIATRLGTYPVKIGRIMRHIRRQAERSQEGASQ